MANHRRLTIYDTDDSTSVAVVSSNPADAYPYLKHQGERPDAGVDLLRGRATIGEVRVEILDKRITPGDQTTGFITQLISDMSGSLANLRTLYEEQDAGGDWMVIMDGVIGTVVLNPTLVSYTITLRDHRERARKVSLFARSGTTALLPRGILLGWGKPPGAGTDTSKWIVPPVKPYRGKYNASAGAGYVDLRPNQWRHGKVTDAMLITDETMDLLAVDQNEVRVSAVGSGATTKGAVYGFASNLEVCWRPYGTSAWNHVRNPATRDVTSVGLQFLDRFSKHLVIMLDAELENGDDVEAAGAIWILNAPGGTDPLPTHNQDIEVVIIWSGPPTEELPLHIEGTAGEVLKDVLDGVYSEQRWTGTEYAPRMLGVRYNEAAVLALQDPVLGVITKPVGIDDADGRRAALGWIEKECLAPLGAVPALNENWELAPIRYRLPQDGSFPTLDNTNCRAASWGMNAADTVNAVRFKYRRHFALRKEDGTRKARPRGGEIEHDTLFTQEASAVFEHTPSIDTRGLGVQAIEVDTELYGSAFPHLYSAMPELVYDLGFRLAQDLAAQATDRFAYGGQVINHEVARSASKDWKIGDWVIVGHTWLPDTVTGKRGLNRLAQIIGRSAIDPAWEKLVTVDAGDSNVPAPVPTIGALAIDAQGRVAIPITAVPQGGHPTYARVEYAHSVMQPAADSGEWIFLGRVGTPGTMYTPPQTGGIVWVRARGEGESMISSAWTTAKFIEVDDRAGMMEARLIVPTDLQAYVLVRGIGLTQGFRVYYAAHAKGADPVFSLYVDAAALGDVQQINLDKEEVMKGRMFSVRIQAWTGWTGAAVTGTLGAERVLTASADVDYLYDLRWERVSGSDTDIRGQWRRVADVPWVYVHNVLTAEAGANDEWPDDTTPPDTILGVGVDQYVTSYPTSGNVRLVQIEARDADLRLLQIERSVIRPPAVSDFDDLVIPAGAIVASKLVRSAQLYDFPNSAWHKVAFDQVDWDAATLEFSDNVTYAILAGSTGTMTNGLPYYIYWTAADPTHFNVTQDWGLVVGDNVVLMAVARRASHSDTVASLGTAVGVLGLSDVDINARAIVAGNIRANEITGVEIFGTSVSGIFGDFGIMTAGIIQNGAGTLLLDLDAVGTDPLLTVSDGIDTFLEILADGSATFAGTIAGEDFTGSWAYFSHGMSINFDGAAGDIMFEVQTDGLYFNYVSSPGAFFGLGSIIPDLAGNLQVNAGGDIILSPNEYLNFDMIDLPSTTGTALNEYMPVYYRGNLRGLRMYSL